ncbi:hypothetical protein [Pseudoalteromonas sp. T1lg75]|uniref:hypothetical protein n=1 Tax=Pseudoalteromonas sp. T1lg75 TaxID=2077102 RepID=UPI000CF6116A|nr:hypothetical protein [Pseudoalteromonas sp. T1lg75]
MMKKYLIASTVALGVFSCTGVAQAGEFDQVQRQIGIVENILGTALKQDLEQQSVQVSSTYLAEQGVLYRIRLDNHFVFVSEFEDIPIPPLPSEVVITADSVTMNDGHMEFVNGEVVGTETKEVIISLDDIREQSEQMRAAAEAQRELSFRIRELNREQRELKMQSKLQDNDQEFTEQLQEIEREVVKLREQKDALDAKNKVLVKEVKEKRLKHKEKQAQQQQEQLRKALTSVARSLCDYGVGMRDISDEQFVNVQFSQSRNQHMAVFKKADINRCVSGKLDHKDLLSRAKQYAL